MTFATRKPAGHWRSAKAEAVKSHTDADVRSLRSPRSGFHPDRRHEETESIDGDKTATIGSNQTEP